MNRHSKKAVKEITLYKWSAGSIRPQKDVVAVEEPMEIKLAYGTTGQRKRESIAITMRTPGQDFDLALGFLYSEGIISDNNDVIQLRYIARQLEESAQENVLLVELNPSCTFDLDRLNRHFYTTSSCGVCGKASIELVDIPATHILNRHLPKLDPNTLPQLPAKLLAAQDAFSKTGGLHAAGLFDLSGKLYLLREDIGRHNALDKLIGAAFQQKILPLKEFILMLSGRISFELVQKALMAGIPIVAAVGAPSSLALELADENNMTLIGFLKNQQFNLYCGNGRMNPEF